MELVQTAAMKPPTEFHRQFFDREVVQVARDLVGVGLTVDGCGGMIVETEAYRFDDAAAHSFSGPTLRNKSMFGPPGHAYVYRSYGMHWCLNFVCRRGCAVLIRALEPISGIPLMMARRDCQKVALLCAGPGRLTRALGVNSSHDGMDLLALPFELSAGLSAEIIEGRRIGISKAAQHPWRFGAKNSAFLSRKF